MCRLGLFCICFSFLLNKRGGVRLAVRRVGFGGLDGALVLHVAQARCICIKDWRLIRLSLPTAFAGRVQVDLELKSLSIRRTCGRRGGSGSGRWCRRRRSSGSWRRRVGGWVRVSASSIPASASSIPASASSIPASASSASVPVVAPVPASASVRISGSANVYRRAGELLPIPCPVGEAHSDSNSIAIVGVLQGVCNTRGVADGTAIPQPLVFKT